MKLNLLFWFVCCIFHKSTAQNAQCSYENSYKDKFNLVTYNSYFYTCFLNTQYSSFNTPILNIVGHHGSGYTDNHVTYLQTAKGSKMRKFSSVYCQKFQNLLSIYVSDAGIESIDENSLRNCNNLEIFGLEHSTMQHVPQNLFIGNLKLKVLTLSGNYLTTLPEYLLINQRELMLLRITQSRLSSLPINVFSSLYKLHVLVLDNNKLQTIIPDWFTNLQNLKLFSLSYNQVTNLPSNAFKGIRNLEKIIISFNKISYLDPNCFYGLYSLKKLNLGGNELTDLPANVFTQLRSLESLELNQNRLTTIHSDSFGSHAYLKTLELQQNQINSFDEKIINTTPVTSINLSQNICSQYELYRSYMKTYMKTCFDNYRQRNSFISHVTYATQAPDSTTTTYRHYAPKATTSKPVTFWQFYKPNEKIQECGRPMVGQGNVIGGKHVSRGDFPWMAVLLKSESYFCGGVLISSRKVVTAAHCMQEKQVREPFRAQEIVVLLGKASGLPKKYTCAYNLNILHEAGRSIFAIQKIEIHPEWLYQAVQYDADIAVLVLIGEVTFTPFIQPICLITARRIAEITNGVAVGYGKSEDQSKLHENIPKIIDTPIYTNQQCFQSNRNLATISSGRTFCGGLGTGVGVCRGDSGGGVYVTAGNIYYLRGIISSSLKNANHECDVDNYSVFTNVLKFNNWIEGIPTEV